jgi:hypothetical protein
MEGNGSVSRVEGILFEDLRTGPGWPIANAGRRNDLTFAIYGRPYR